MIRPIALIVTFAIASASAGAPPPRQMENLGRGVVAINQGDGKVFVSWRMLGTDPDSIAFNLHRTVGNDVPVKLRAQPITGPTFFVDDGAKLQQVTAYLVLALLDD